MVGTNRIGSSGARYRLFRLVWHAERPTQWWLIPLLLLLFQLAGIFGLVYDLEPAEDASLLRGAIESASYFIYSYIPMAALIWAWLRFYEKRPFWTVGLPLDRQALAGILGFLYAAALFSLAIGAMLITGDAEALSANAVDLAAVAFLPTLIMLVGWGVQGMTEELMFRGWFFQVTGEKIGALLAGLVTTGFFAAAHLANPGISPLALANLFLIGVLFCLLALNEGGIWAAGGFHIAWNWIQSNVYGFTVSGLDVGGGSLMRVRPDGADWVTGGEFGFEGSVYASAVIILGIIGVLIFGQVSGRLKLPSSQSPEGSGPRSG